MDTLLQDVRYAVRRFQKDPAFAVVAVFTLAIGIGANSAIFSVLNGVLLKPLPYRQSDRLVATHHVTETGQRAVMSPLNFLDWKSQSRTVADAAAYSSGSYTLTGVGEAARVNATDVSGSFFDVLGVQAALGRGFRSQQLRARGPRTRV